MLSSMARFSFGYAIPMMKWRRLTEFKWLSTIFWVRDEQQKIADCLTSLDEVIAGSDE